MENNFDKTEEVVNEIRTRLFHEINESANNIKSAPKMDYYNAHLGDTSFLLAALLGVLLEKEDNDWDSERWFDDSLLTRVDFNEDKISLCGVMIWGIDSDTEQWTEPFYCELDFDSTGINNYLFLFSDRQIGAVTYTDFNRDRSIWNFEYYFDDQWLPINSMWKYRISS